MCKALCTYRALDGSLRFDCRVDNDGEFESVSYTIDGPPTFIIPNLGRIEGLLY